MEVVLDVEVPEQCSEGRERLSRSCCLAARGVQVGGTKVPIYGRAVGRVVVMDGKARAMPRRTSSLAHSTYVDSLAARAKKIIQA
jgi:hypothetical protein